MRLCVLALLVVSLTGTSAQAADLDRAAVDFKTPDDIKWIRNAAATGETFDPESTAPVPAGSYVIHYGGKVHYDGAKSEETIIQAWGIGPATATPAEKK